MIFDTKGQSKTTYLHTWVSPNPSTKMGIKCCKKHIINGKFETSFTSFGKTQKRTRNGKIPKTNQRHGVMDYNYVLPLNVMWSWELKTQLTSGKREAKCLAYSRPIFLTMLSNKYKEGNFWSTGTCIICITTHVTSPQLNSKIVHHWYPLLYFYYIVQKYIQINKKNA